MFTPSAVLSSFSYIMELLPFHLLAYYPFRGQFRFPLWIVLFINGFNMSLQFLLCCFLYGTGGNIRSWDGLVMVVYMTTYLCCVKAETPKLLFIYTLVTDYIIIVRGIAIFLGIRFFTEPGETYQLLGAPTDTMLRMISFVITGPFMLSFLNITKERVLRSHAPELWRTIWLIPALNSVIVLFFTWDLNIVTISGMAFLLTRISLLIMAFIVYYILVSSLEFLRLQGEAEERARNQEQIMDMQRARYSMLQKQIEETRHARHDLKQHLNVIKSCLENGDEEKLKDYIAKYSEKLTSLTPKTYCANYAIDAIIRHYGEIAYEHNVRFDTHIQLPSQLRIKEPDICILFGNLLENAVNACMEEFPEPPFICVHARAAGERAISITVDNSCKTPRGERRLLFVLQAFR